MSIPSGSLVLLDTNVIVHLAREDDTGRNIEDTHALAKRTERPLISTVCEGEILGLARYWRWGEERTAALRRLLAEFVRVESSLPDVVETYAELYAENERGGHGCGENDLWIAATAKVAGAILLTCDKDFDWLHPKHVTRYYVPEAS